MPATVTDLLKLMGSSRIKEKGFEVTASCPFAPWLHERGRDRHPSFGVNMLLNDGNGVYHCFACGKSGTVYSMVKDYCELSGKDFWQFKKILEELKVEYAVDISKLNKEEKFEVPKEEIEEYEAAKKRQIYPDILRYNNIFPETIANWEIAATENKIIFPVKNRLDNILFFVYRWLSGGSSKYTVSKGARSKSAVFGLNMVDVLDENKPIIIVEGILDAIYLNQLGFNSVAIFGVYLDYQQLDIIRSISPSDRVGIIFDDDEAGQEGIADAANKLGKYFYDVRTLNVPALRMLDAEEINNFIGGRHVREYF